VATLIKEIVEILPSPYINVPVVSLEVELCLLGSRPDDADKVGNEFLVISHLKEFECEERFERNPSHAQLAFCLRAVLCISHVTPESSPKRV